MDSALEPPEGVPLWGRTDLGLTKRISDVGVQKRGRMKFCCFEAPSLWLWLWPLDRLANTALRLTSWGKGELRSRGVSLLAPEWMRRSRARGGASPRGPCENTGKDRCHMCGLRWRRKQDTLDLFSVRLLNMGSLRASGLKLQKGHFLSVYFKRRNLKSAVFLLGMRSTVLLEPVRNKELAIRVRPGPSRASMPCSALLSC